MNQYCHKVLENPLGCFCYSSHALRLPSRALVHARQFATCQTCRPQEKIEQSMVVELQNFQVSYFKLRPEKITTNSSTQ
jgi:hypothetical protein